MDEVRFAWAAGLFDGEGSVSLHFSATRAKTHSLGSSYRFRLRVGQSDPAAVTVFRELFAGQINEVDPPGLGRRRHFVWQQAGARAVEAAKLMLPYSVIKHERLRLFIEAWEQKNLIPHVSLGPGSGRGSHHVSDEVAVLLDGYVARIKALNQKGPRV